MNQKPITVFFLDIGGVLLSNGWSRDLRRRAAETLGLDHEDMDERHHLTFGTYEEGKLSLDQYLNRVVFFRDRPFTREDFKTFMFAQSKSIPEMIELIRQLKQTYKLKIAAVSNEGRELTIYRVKKFNLSGFIDFFIVSCFVHFRKPDEDIYRIALDCAQVPAEEVVYIDDRAMFVEIAQGLGIRGIVHTGFESTRKKLKTMGLEIHA